MYKNLYIQCTKNHTCDVQKMYFAQAQRLVIGDGHTETGRKYALT